MALLRVGSRCVVPSAELAWHIMLYQWLIRKSTLTRYYGKIAELSRTAPPLPFWASVNRTTFNDSGGAKSDKDGLPRPPMEQPGLAELSGIPVGAGQKAPEKRQSGGQIRTKDRG